MERKRKENGFEHSKKDSGLKLICYSRDIITFQGACVCVLSCSHVQLFATPWTIARQAPLSMGFSRQEYWHDCHFLLQGIFPTQGLNHISCVFCISSWVLYH